MPISLSTGDVLRLEHYRLLYDLVPRQTLAESSVGGFETLILLNSHGRSMERSGIILRVSEVSVDFQGNTVLDRVSFEVSKGTTLAITGPNGAGKSVLFRVLLGITPYAGKVEWIGSVRKGYVPQLLSPRDLPVSVKEFMRFKSAMNIAETLNMVGLDSEQVMHKSLGVLSGGQLRRVLIAWAILDQPDVLLFDEPTTGVDLDSEEAIYMMLRRLVREKGITLLLISHSPHIISEYSEHLLAINRCVTFAGPAKDIMTESVQNIIYGEPVCMLRQG